MLKFTSRTNLVLQGLVKTKCKIEDVVYHKMLFYWALHTRKSSFHCVLKTSLSYINLKPRMLACEPWGASLKTCEPTVFYIFFLLKTYDRVFMNLDYKHVQVLGLGFPVQISMKKTTNLDLMLKASFFEQYRWSIHNVYQCK